jgi:hypothetical protein
MRQVVLQAIVFADAAADPSRAPDPGIADLPVVQVSELAEVIKSRDPARIRQAFLLWLGRLPRHQLRALEVLMYCGREGWALDDDAYAEVDDRRPAETIAGKTPAGEYLAAALKRADQDQVDLDAFAEKGKRPIP